LSKLVCHIWDAKLSSKKNASGEIFFRIPLIATISKMTAQDYFEIGKRKMEKKDQPKAVDRFSDTLRLDKDFDLARCYLAVASYDMGNMRFSLDNFEKIKNIYDPDIIFTHYGNDSHQDHKLISNLTWNTYRDHFILEYEIPKYDGDLVTPNLYSNIEVTDVDNKVDRICRFFKSQEQRTWFSEETFRSIMRIRGIESNSSSGYAEAFHSRKIII